MAQNNYFGLKNYLVKLWREVDSSQTKLYEFGMALTWVGLVITLFLYLKNGYVNVDLLIVLIVFSGLATFLPQSLTQFHKTWFVLAIVIGEVISRLLLSIVFITIIFPLSLFMKLRGHQFLDNSINPNKKSYWIKFNRFEKTKKNFLNQF